ncbi:MAG: phenylalanine--tRNA ligase subunit beta, partial [Gammaproteobacteria bacterium]
LTLAGLEVDSVEPVAAEFRGVVAAEIKALHPHPTLTHLRVCAVSCGEHTPVVVCGASNVRPGMRVPFARLGASLPGGRIIERASFEGVISEGMLCSAEELGLAGTSEGILELPLTVPIGADVWDALALADQALEVALTPNRGDCLGVAGLAREIGVLYGCPIHGPAPHRIALGTDEVWPITIAVPAACPHYAGRVVRGIDPQAETPLWMREHLRRGGLRSISPVVDVTNFVMLELGQPMHAFDLDKLQGAIVVRFSHQGERLALLDGQTLELDADTLVIADAGHPVALAGIMGGVETAVTGSTRAVFLESAFFSPASVAGKARRYRLQTDSSHRFERGVDFELQVRAIERASELLVVVCGGHPGPVVDRYYAESLPRRQAIKLRASRIARVLGTEVAAEEVETILTRLGVRVSGGDDVWDCVPPSFRFDLTIEADLVEEVARIRGYETIAGQPARQLMSMRARPEAAIDLGRIHQVLVERGYQEAITYSFVDPAVQARLTPDLEPVVLANPIASDMAVMRTSLWAGLLQALKYNQNRQCDRVRLFESGLTFIRGPGGVDQRPMLGGVLWGLQYPEQWAEPKREADFFDIKGDVEALSALLDDTPERVSYQPAVHPALHPYRASRVHKGNQSLGTFGALHPELAAVLGLEQPVFLFEIDLNVLTHGAVPRFSPISKLPMVRRDISVLVDRDVAAAELMRCVAQTAPNELRDFQLFDLYQGEGIDPKKKSIALGLIFQGTSSTLTDAEVDKAVERVLKRLQERFEVTLRS